MGAVREKPRLFISHSSHDLALTQSVVAALEPPVAPHPGFEVLVDKTFLKGSDDWPFQLHAMMAFAHAGLLLFTRAAMNRPDWIRKEAYILTWRRSLDPSFKVFYVFLDDVTEQDLIDKGFAPAHLNLIQRLAATDPEKIAEEIRPLVPARRPGTPFERLTLFLSQHLKLEADALDELAAELAAPPLPWLPGGRSGSIGAIAARILAGQFGNIPDLGSLLNMLKVLGVQTESLLVILRWVAPYWLAPEAAARLAAVARNLWSNQIGGWALINGDSVADYTAPMMVFKALPFDFQYQIASIEGGTSDPGVEYYSHAICDAVRTADRAKDPKLRVGYPDDDTAMIAQLKKDKPFLFVPLKTPDRETLDGLRDRFPKVVFLLWTGPALEPLAFDLPVVALEPEIDGGREGTEYADWRSAKRSLGG